jgi:hypothetical protein
MKQVLVALQVSRTMDGAEVSRAGKILLLVIVETQGCSPNHVASKHE